jgi:hypothetical protein
MRATSPLHRPYLTWYAASSAELRGRVQRGVVGCLGERHVSFEGTGAEVALVAGQGAAVPGGVGAVDRTDVDVRALTHDPHPLGPSGAGPRRRTRPTVRTVGQSSSRSSTRSPVLPPGRATPATTSSP